MRDLAMQMTGSSGVLSVPDEHLPGFIALVLIGPVVWMALAGLRALASRRVGWADRAQVRLDRLPFAAKVVLFGTFIGAVVHAAIVPTHWGNERVTAVLFIVDTIGFGVAFWWTFTDRAHWRLVSVAMLGGTACFYAFYILRGWETMDLVGLVTTTIEAAAARWFCRRLARPRWRVNTRWRLALFPSRSSHCSGQTLSPVRPRRRLPRSWLPRPIRPRRHHRPRVQIWQSPPAAVRTPPCGEWRV